MLCDWLDLPCKYKIVIAGNHDLSLDKGWYEIDQNWKSLGLPKFTTSCNGEATEIMRSCKNFIYLEESEVVVEGYKILDLLQPEFCNWAFNLERGEKCDEKWNNIPTDTDILTLDLHWAMAIDVNMATEPDVSIYCAMCKIV